MFRESIAKAVAKASGLEEEKILEIIEIPSDQSMGDYALPCFTLSRQLRKKPSEIAEELAGKINAKEIDRAEAKGPYINFFVKTELLAEQTLKRIFKEKENFGKQKKKDFKVMVEYSQPNTHKEFHVGHLRTLFLGESISRILEFNGKKVVRANYIGDVGAHIAKCLWGFLNFHKNDPIPENRGKFLGQIYTEANTLAEKSTENKKQISEIQQKLENDDKDMKLIWLQTREWSMKEFMDIYKELNVEFDIIYFESEVEKPGKKIVKELLDKKIAKEDEGAVLIDLEQYRLGKFLLLKSDQTSLYSTKDLALARKKFEDYKLDESIYVVDSRQKLYFQQLFKTLEIIGFKKKTIHIPYEFVSLKEGVISSRSGVMALYEDLRDKMAEKAKNEILIRHKDWDEKQILNTAKTIVESALKFSFLKIDQNKVIVFDMDEALDFEGETGPYVQYTHARLNSIIEKSGKKPSEKTDYSLLSENEEKAIISKLAEFENTIVNSCEQYKPSLVARYLIELCQALNEYYHKHNILKAEEATKKARLLLVSSAKQLISSGLALLNIRALDEM